MADESDNDLRVKLLLGENSRFYSENCHLKSLNSNLTSKLKELRLKVENLLLVFSEIPQGHGIKDTVRINGKEKYWRRRIIKLFIKHNTAKKEETEKQ